MTSDYNDGKIKAETENVVCSNTKCFKGHFSVGLYLLFYLVETDLASTIIHYARSGSLYLSLSNLTWFLIVFQTKLFLNNKNLKSRFASASATTTASVTARSPWTQSNNSTECHTSDCVRIFVRNSVTSCSMQMYAKQNLSYLSVKKAPKH